MDEVTEAAVLGVRLFVTVLAQIATDCAVIGCSGFGVTDQAACLRDGVVLGHDAGDDTVFLHILDESGEEFLLNVFVVVVVEQLGAGFDGLDLVDSESLGFEPGQDLTDQVALDRVWLEQDQGLVPWHRCVYLAVLTS